MPSWSPDIYCLGISARTDFEIAEKVFDLVWRVDFTAPGFAVLDAGADIDSPTLRTWMMGLKTGLSEVGVRRGGKPFVFRSLARFDQQETTKFHLDGAPPESLLMLGYEPSNVRSRLFLADYTRAAFDLAITPAKVLQDYNPMYKKGEELLSRYVTELPQPAAGHSWILLVNNSSLGFTESRTNPLGVMHKAIIDTPDEAKRRIVNSSMLVAADAGEISREQQQEFATTDKISQKVY